MTTPQSRRDPRIDAYIARSAEFARPILSHLRELIHEGCPQVTETLKWSMPAFEYKGVLCGMAAFKQHCTFGFWKHALVFGDDATPVRTRRRGAEASPGARSKGGKDRASAHGRAAGAARSAKTPAAASTDAMGQFGRITHVSQLPPRRVLLGFIRKAVKLNEDGVKVPRPKPSDRKRLVTPRDLAAALRGNAAAAATFARFSYSHRREYIEWLTEAKAKETRQRRLAKAIEWLSEGKSRNWKYQRR